MPCPRSSWLSTMQLRTTGRAMLALTPLWSHQIELEAEPISASQTRAFVSRCLVEHQLSHLVDEVRLVASELATNALVHARTAFTVALSQPDGIVLLAVRDRSEGVLRKGVAAVTDTYGRGLDIVELMSLEWGIDQAKDGSKSVWASFPLAERTELSATTLTR
jgi:hypothetical protein